MTRKPVDIGGALSHVFQVPVEADSAPVNLLAGASARRSGAAKQGELDESPHLLAVRQAVDGIRNGDVTDEEYYQTVSTVHLQISELLGLFEMGQVQRELAQAGDEDRQLAERTRQGLMTVEQGLARLVNYLESQEKEDLEEGMAQVEAGYLELDQTQDDALLLVEDEEEDDEEDE
jgi:hypothetical protein